MNGRKWKYSCQVSRCTQLLLITAVYHPEVQVMFFFYGSEHIPHLHKLQSDTNIQQWVTNYPLFRSLSC